jgi:hypothetical protein
MAMEGPTTSLRESTLRRQTRELYAKSSHATRGLFDSDSDDELKTLPTPSQIALPKSSSPSKMLAPSPGLNTLRRQNRELLSQLSLDNDDDEREPHTLPQI